MGLIGSWAYTFQDGVGAPYVASGVQVMANLDQIKNVVDGNIEESNVKTASKIMCTDRAKTITAVYTFGAGANPVFQAGAILDAYLTSNVPLKDAANTFSGNNTFSGSNTFNQAIEGLKPPTLAVHPSTAGDDGKVYIYSGDSQLYIYKHGTGPVQLDYTGGGVPPGTVMSYNGEITIDDGTPAIFMIKTTSGFTSAKLKMTAFPFPTYPYTELPAHTHAVGTLALSSGAISGLNHTHNVVMGTHTHLGSFGNSAHTHTISTHRHALSLSTGAGSAHNHAQQGTIASANQSADHSHQYDSGSSGSDWTSGVSANHTHNVTLSGNTGNESSHTHSISGYSAYSGDLTSGAPSATSSVTSTDLGTIVSQNPNTWSPSVGTALSGFTGSNGISGGSLNDTQKVNVDTAIQVYISSSPTSWGTAKDSGTPGWSSLANILAASGGTSEIDISSYLTPSTFYYIKVVEPTAKKGGRIAYHVEIA